MKLSKHLAVLIFSIWIVTSPPVAAQARLTRVKTDAGCDAYVSDPGPTGWKVQHTWSGKCVDGLATGWGTLVRVSSNENTVAKNEYESWRVAGRMVGYRRANIGGPLPYIEFWYNDKSIAWIPGMGLDIDESSFKLPSVVLPKEVPSLPRHYHLTLNSPIGDATLSTARCNQGVSTYPKELLAYCSIGFPRGYNLTYFLVSVTNTQGKKEEYLCDDYENPASCAAIVNRVAAHIRAAIFDFIANAKPVVDVALAQADAQAKFASRREAEERALSDATAQRARDDEAKRQAQVEELARLDRESEALKLRSGMDSASAGALFALADELKQKGDLVNARVALRKLVSKYPDHKLAELAARMLHEQATR